MKRLAAGIVAVLCLNAPATAEMYKIKNPAEKISNSADKMYNPATQVNNPASNIYNPVTRMDNPNPLSPTTQPVPQPVVKVTTTITPEKQIKEQQQPKPTIPKKSYHYKKVKTYMAAAKKAFAQDDYITFLSITEDALRRITAGTLKASKKTKQKLDKYKDFGYGLLEKNDD